MSANKSLKRQLQENLQSKLKIGESRHEYKKQYGRDTYIPYIFSWSTYRTYQKHGYYFLQYCKEKHNCKTIEECRQYADEWLSTRTHLSPYTQNLEMSALGKIYSCPSTEFDFTPKTRHRSDIVRSRVYVERDRNFSYQNNWQLVDFCRSTGLRRAELTTLKGSQLVERDGKYYIAVKGKGGKYREAPVINNIDLVVEMMRNAGDGLVFSHIHNAADIHSYRAEYATDIYEMHARQIEDIPRDKQNEKTGRWYQSDVYHCRGDMKGVLLDRAAMREASIALGHNRVSVFAYHYLRL